MSVVSGAVAERMKLWAFLIFYCSNSIYLPNRRLLDLGRWLPSDAGFSDFAGSGIANTWQVQQRL